MGFARLLIDQKAEGELQATEIEQLQAKLAAARWPWWRRLIGSSR
jgi:hypothetical protein